MSIPNHTTFDKIVEDWVSQKSPPVYCPYCIIGALIYWDSGSKAAQYVVDGKTYVIVREGSPPELIKKLTSFDVSLFILPSPMIDMILKLFEIEQNALRNISKGVALGSPADLTNCIDTFRRYGIPLPVRFARVANLEVNAETKIFLAFRELHLCPIYRYLVIFKGDDLFLPAGALKGSFISLKEGHIILTDADDAVALKLNGDDIQIVDLEDTKLDL